MGGVGIYQNHLHTLHHGRFEFHFLAPEQHLGFLDDNLMVTTFTRKNRGAISLKAFLSAFRKARSQVRPDLYFFHSTFSLAALFLLRLMGDRTPAAYFPHGWAIGNYPAASLKGRFVRIVEGRLCRLANCIVNVSYHERKLAEGFGYGGQMSVIENSVPDMAEVQPQCGGIPAKDDGRLDLLFVGRFDRQKGLDILLPAFEKASRNRPDLHLHIIGGSVRGDIEAPPLPKHVNLVGWVDRSELDLWYRFADALIVPSRWEGLPLVIPESFRNGTPVLCAERSGMETLLTRGETGDHFPLDPQSIQSLLESLDRETLNRMRPACRAHYENRFSLPRWQERILSLIDKLLAGKTNT